MIWHYNPRDNFALPPGKIYIFYSFEYRYLNVVIHGIKIIVQDYGTNMLQYFPIFGQLLHLKALLDPLNMYQL